MSSFTLDDLDRLDKKRPAAGFTLDEFDALDAKLPPLRYPVRGPEPMDALEPQESAQEQQPGVLDDMGRMVGIGLNDMASAAGVLLKKAGLEGAGEWVKEKADSRVKQLTGELSPEQSAANTLPFVVEKPEGGYGFGPGATSPRKIAGAIAGSLPATGTGMGIGMGMARQLIAAGLSPAAAGIIGGAIGEGGTAAAMNYAEVYEAALTADVYKTPEFEQALASLDADTPAEQREALAREKVASSAALQSAGLTGFATAILGAPSGAALGRILGGETGKNFITTLAKQGMLEALQEAPQEAVQTYVTGKALGQYVDPGLEANTLSLLEAATGGAIVGAAMGVGSGGGGVAMSKLFPVERPTATPPPQTPPPSTGDGTIDLATGQPVAPPLAPPATPAPEREAAQGIVEQSLSEALPAEPPPVAAAPQAEPSPQAETQPAPAEEVTPESLLVDLAAHESATSPLNDRPEPTEAQQQAGNYKKGKVQIQGMDISIENPAGSTRSGTDEDGRKWQTKLRSHYGYFKRSEGADGEQLDVFLAPGAEVAESIYIVDQIDPKTGAFDEHKVVMGPKFEEGARMAYLSNYDKSGMSRLGAITEVSLDEFKQWRKTGDTTKPFSDQVKVAQVEAVQEAAPAAEVAPEPDPVVERLPMSEGTEVHVIKNNSGYVVSMMDTDAGKYLPTLRQYRGAEALQQAQQYAREVAAKDKKTEEPPVAAPEPPKKDVHAAYKEKVAAKKAAAEPAVAVTPEVDLPQERRDFITNKVKTLGSVAAVDQAYAGDSAVDKFARESARGMFAQVEKKADLVAEAGKMVEPKSQESGHYAAGQNAFKSGKPRVLPSYFTSSNGKNPKDWFRGWDAANKEAQPAPTFKETLTPTKPAPPTRVADDRNAVGKNRDGKELFEDKIGVRFYVENGVKIGTATKIVPVRGQGMVPQAFTLRELFNRGDLDFLTAEELQRFEPKPEPAEAVAPKPAPVQPLPQTYGADNKLVTRDRAEELAAKLREKASRLSSGVDPELLMLGAELAVYHLESGARSFVRFSKAMANHLGQETAAKLVPYFKSWYAAARNWPGLDRTGMDNEATVDALDIGDILDTKEAADERTAATQPEPLRQGVPESPDGQSQAVVRGNEDGRQPSPPSAGEGRESSEPVREPDAQRSTGDRSGRSGDQGTDFVITPEFGLGKGGQKAKYRDNVAAIRTLRQLQAENRPATPEEQAILARYVGWGGIPQAFDPDNDKWAKEYGELQQLFPEDEWKAARRSTQDAHYTAEGLVRGMWDAVRRMGFTSGKVLEPSVGTGNFIGLAPQDLKRHSHFTAIELDPTTAAIAAALYPQQQITQSGFQDFQSAPNYFDLAIGNPPFGDQKLFDSARKDLSSFSIHNYFFAKSLDSVRPGGVLAMVVSNYLMDQQNGTAREYLAKNARLLGAIRLPSSAFAENALTDVTTDVVFLQRLAPGETADASWTKVGSVEDPQGGEPIALNSYFVANPGMMMGRMERTGGRYSKDMANLIEVSDGRSFAERLAGMIANLPENVITSRRKDIEARLNKVEAPEAGAGWSKQYGYLVGTDGQVLRRLPDLNGKLQVESAGLSGKSAQRVKGLLGIRDSVRDLVRLEMTEGTTDTQLKHLRLQLNSRYDAFVKENGLITDRANTLAFRDDPDFPLLLSLEKNYDPGISKERAKASGLKPSAPAATKADIFTKRVRAFYVRPESADSPQDALVIALRESGKVDMERMTELTGQDEATLAKELVGRIFRDPEAGWVTGEAYLSGNVKAKLQKAREAGYGEGIDALEKVQPPDVAAIDIHVNVGAPWVPGDVYAKFLRDKGLGAAKVSYIQAAGRFAVQFTSYGSQIKAREEFGTARMSGDEIFTKMLNGQDIAVYDTHVDGSRALNREETTLAANKAKELQRTFKEWIWEDADRRDTLGKLYNEKYNTNRERQYDGSLMIFPGKVPDEIFDFREHQKNVVWRFLQEGRGLADHVVGAGKTAVMVGAAIEGRRMGLFKKPMFVVPNHLVEQWAKAFYEIYPGANVLAIGRNDFEKSKRRQFMARISTGDWDAVIVAHSSYQFIPPPPEHEARFYREQIEELEAAIREMKADRQDKRTIKQIEKAKERLQEKLKALGDVKRDDLVHFGELGVDAVMVDEADEFKNLYYVTKKSRISGLNNQKGSKKAFDMFVKTRYISEVNGGNGRGVYFATGTPIANSMAEMYHMQRYLDYDNLKRMGLLHFDAWADTFATPVSDWELAPSGTSYRLVTGLKKFVNLPELMTAYRSFTDVITLKMLQEQYLAKGKRWPVPKIRGGKPQNVVVSRSEDQASFMDYIVWRMENMPKDPREDNPLKATSEAAKAALDMRLIDPNAADLPGSKINTAVDNIFEVWQKWRAKKGAQLVFCDLSVPKNGKDKQAKEIEGLMARAEQGDEEAMEKLEAFSYADISALTSSFSVYDDIKQKLIGKGVPVAEIAFIHDANTDKQKEDLFDRVRSGKVRVLIGSTAKMGAGMNVQDRLVALHHLDAPWRPRDLEQREGRIIRQGNLFFEADPDGFEIDIKRYATELTLDARRWQVIETKASFIGQVRSGAVTSREVDDVGQDAANAAEMKASASGNPLILEEITLRKTIQDLEAEEYGWRRSKYNFEEMIRKGQDAPQETAARVASAKMAAEIAGAKPHKGGSPEWSITIGRKEFRAKIEEGTQGESEKDKKAREKRNEEAIKENSKAARAKLGQEIVDYIQSKSTIETPLASYRGFQVTIRGLFGGSIAVEMHTPLGKRDVGFYSAGEEISPSGLITRLDNRIDEMADQGALKSFVERAEAHRDSLIQQGKEAARKLGLPFEQADQLAEKRSRHAEVLAELQSSTASQGQDKDFKPSEKFARWMALGASSRGSAGRPVVVDDDGNTITGTDPADGIPFEDYKPAAVKWHLLAKGDNDNSPKTRRLYLGNLNGEPAFSNGHYALVGKIPPQLDAQLKAQSEEVNLQQVANHQPGDDLTPIGFTQTKEGRGIWFDKGYPIDANYFDFIRSQYPDARFNAPDGFAMGKTPYLVYSGKKLVGVVMSKAEKPSAGIMSLRGESTEGTASYSTRTVDEKVYGNTGNVVREALSEGRTTTQIPALAITQKQAHALQDAGAGHLVTRVAGYDTPGEKGWYAVNTADVDRRMLRYDTGEMVDAVSREAKDIISKAGDPAMLTARMVGGRPILVNEANYDPASPEARYSFAPTPDNVTDATVKAAFPTATKIESTVKGTWVVSLPNGASVTVKTGEHITINEAAYSKGYGMAPSKGEIAVGEYRTSPHLDTVGIIRLAKAAGEGTLDHEHFHAAMALALNQSQRNLVLAKHKTEEAAAKAYEAWSPGQPGGFFQRIYDFARNLLRLFRKDTVEDVFRDIKSGKVWAQRGQGVQSLAFSTQEKARAWFSKLSQTIEQKMPAKMNAADFLRWIQKPEQGITRDELEQSGILAEVEGKKTVSKEDVAGLAQANSLEFEDVVLGDEDPHTAARAAVERYAADAGYTVEPVETGGMAVKSKSGRVISQGSATDIASELGIRSEMMSATHFSQYTEPGAVEGSYRELFVTAPNASRKLPPHIEVRNTPGSDTWAVWDNEAERVIGLASTEEKALARAGIVSGVDWQDGHSQYNSVSNPIVRIRFNERTVDGKRTLFVEEMQGPSDANQKKMPEFLRKRIYDIGVKRVLSYAKENGFDAVSWTPGEMQAQRYDLSKQVDKIEYWDQVATSSASGKPSRAINIDMAGGVTQSLEVDQSGEVLWAYGQSSLVGKRLDEVIGKDLAKRILEDPKKGNIEGEDLSVGGEGLKRLYDQTLPALFKKHGKGVLGRVDIATRGDSEAQINDWSSVPGYEGVPGNIHSVPFMTLTDKTPAIYPQYATSKTPGMTLPKLWAAMAGPIQAFPDHLRFHPVASEKELPHYLQEAVEQANEDGGAVLALLDETTGLDIYVLANRARTAADVQTAIFHEGYGHVGFRNLLGKDAVPVLNMIAQAFPRRMKTVGAEYKHDLSNSFDRIRTAEEILAQVAERNEHPNLIARAVEALKTWLIRHGFTDWKYTDADLVALIARGKRKLDNGGHVDGKRPYGRAAAPTLKRRAIGTPEQEAALEATMATPKHDMTWSERISNLVRRVVSIDSQSLRQGYLDEFASVEDYEIQEFGELLDAAISPSKGARMTKNLDSVLAAIMMRGALVYRNGTFQLEDAENGKGFAEIFAPLTNHADGNLLRLWEGWAAAVRASRLIGEGRERNFSQAQIDALLPLEQQYPLFRDIFNEYQEFNRKILNLAEATGVIDGAARAQWEQNDYIPFYRVVEEIEGTGEGTKGPFKKKGLAGQRSGIMRLKGGEGKINVMENMVLNASKLIDASFKNVAAQRIIDMTENLGAVEEISKTWKPVMVPNSMIRKALQNAGILPDNDTSWQTAIDTGLGQVGEFTDEELGAWSKLLARWAPQGKDIVSVLYQGKPRYFKVNDPVLLRSITNMGSVNYDGILRLMGQAKRLLTASVTVNPAFMLANYLRDTLSTWVVTHTKMKPLLSSTKHLLRAMGTDTNLLKIMAAGGGGGGYYHVRKEGTRALIADQVRTMQSNNFQATVLNSPRKLWRFYKKIGAATESANRLVIFEQTLRQGASTAEAAYQAMDVLNFSRTGDAKLMRFLVQTIPFLNARVQGLNRLYRGAKANPMSFAAKGLILTGASIALMALNMGNPDYEDLPEWDKDLYWHFFTPFGHFRLPKPFEVGAVFATIPERMMFLIRDGEGELFAKRIGRMFLDTFAFEPLPQLFKPVVEQVANKSFFKGSPIVPLHLHRLQPEAQFEPWTSETLRLIADGMPDSAPEFLRSPRRLEHLLYGYVSSISTYALMASDAVLRKTGDYPQPPAGSVQDLPVLNRFVRDEDPRTTKYSSEFYDMANEAAKVYATIKRYRQQGNIKLADELLAKNADKLAARPTLNQVQERLQEINNMTRLVWSSRTMEREEKQRRVDALTKEKNRLQKLAVERYGERF